MAQAVPSDPVEFRAAVEQVLGRDAPATVTRAPERLGDLLRRWRRIAGDHCGDAVDQAEGRSLPEARSGSTFNQAAGSVPLAERGGVGKRSASGDHRAVGVDVGPGNEQCVQDGHVVAAGCPVQRRLPVAADEARVDVGASLHKGGHRGGPTGEVTGPVGDHMQQGPRRAVVTHPHSGQGRHVVEEPTKPVDVSGVDRVDRRGGEGIVHRQQRGQCPSFVGTHRMNPS